MTTPPVPAQRKVKLLTQLKTTQSEQVTKLQAKHQLETDLLEDIRSYAKARATAEKDYAQALQKITSQMMNKFQKEEGKEEDVRTPYGLWKKILEDTEIIATARLKVSQTLMTDIAESIKILKTERVATLKKCSALHDKLHEELFSSASDMVKAQKGYNEFEKLTLQANTVVKDINEKIKKGTIGIFSSKAKLEKNLSKANEKQNVSEMRSTKSRNEYLLHIAAMNAHQEKYYGLDLPDLIAMQDGSIYGSFKDYYSVITNAEKEVCQQSLSNLEILHTEIQELQRAYAIQLFLKENLVFTKCIPFEMISVPGDEVNTLSEKYEAGLQLNKDARKFCTRLAQRQRQIRKKTKELTKLKSMESTDANLNTVPEVSLNEGKDAKAGPVKTKEERIEIILEEIRHLEVLRTKCEAKIEALKQAGIDTDEWLQDAMNEQDDDDENENEQESENYKDDDGEDDFDEWDEPSQGYSASNYSDDALSTTSSEVQRIGMPAIVVYQFEATVPEELSVTEGEDIEFLETQGDGWCKARNKSGQVGFVPETYIELKDRPMTLDIGDTGQMSDAFSIESHSECQTPTSVQSAPFVVSETTETKLVCVCYAKAIYDYVACEDEELSFKEGDVIMVTSCEVEEDDGWWEGVLNGRRGVFPSIVVEKTSAPDSSIDDPILRQRSQTDQFNTS